MVETLLLGLLLTAMCGSIYAYPVPAAGSESGSPESSNLSISVSALSPSSAFPAPHISYSYSVGDSDTVLHNSASASIISNGNSIPSLSSLESSGSASFAGYRQEETMPVRNERSTNLSAETFGSSRKIHIFIMNRLLQISPDGVVNGTYDDTKYTILQRITISRGQLLIQSAETCQYLCMDSCGFMYGSRKATNECVFNEILGVDNWNTYSSTKYSNSNRTLYMALNRNGQPRKVLLRANHKLGGLATFTRVLTLPLTDERLLHHLRHSQHNHRCSDPEALQGLQLDTNQRLQPSSDDVTVLGYSAGVGNGPAPSHSPANHLQCRRRRWRRKKKRRKQPHNLPQSNKRLINSSNINDSSITNVKCSNSNSNSADGKNEECQRKDGSRGQGLANRKWRRGKGMPRKRMQNNGSRRPTADTATVYSVPANEGSPPAMPVAAPAEDIEEDAGDSSTQIEWEEHDTTSHPDLPDLAQDFHTDLEDSSAIMTHPD